MTTKTEHYSVFNHKDEHQASYSTKFADALNWAKDCARHVGGYVCYIFEDGEIAEKTEVFNARKRK